MSPKQNKFKNYIELMRLHRPIGIFLLLWPTWIALWLADEGFHSIKLWLVFTLGVIVTRSLGCVVNDLADRNFDPFVKRTQSRPLAAQKVSVREALWLCFGLGVFAFILVCFTNFETFLLSWIALGLAVSYPFMKRYTHWPQVVLGAAFAWAIPMAYMAVQTQLPVMCWILFTATVIWAMAYDTLYAMTDRADDIKLGVKSTAILWGNYDKAGVLASHLVTLGLYVLVGYFSELHVLFYGGVVIALGLALYEQWMIREREPQQCFNAFLHNNTIGAVLFLGVVFG